MQITFFYVEHFEIASFKMWTLFLAYRAQFDG